MEHPSLPPIHDRVSILAFLRGQQGADGLLLEPSVSLPDEKPRTPGGLSFGAGALDGVAGRHFGAAGQETDRAGAIADLVIQAAAEPSTHRLRKLYDELNTEDILSFIDPMIEALGAAHPPTAAVAQLGTWLASTAPDRGPTKVGIALLGITGAPDGTLLHDLGGHEEFTLYAAVAFGNSRSDPEPDIFALAKRVKGWGRIHCVERLRSTTNPEIAQWILREGFRNSVMNEYLAYIAATTGDLAAALEDPAPDRELLTAAADIIQALIFGGPAEGIGSYSAAPAVLARWLDHMHDRAETLGDFSTIRSIRGFCDWPGWSSRLEDGSWTAEARDALRAQSQASLEHPRWPTLVRDRLNSRDGQQFHLAVEAARTIGIDPLDQLLARIEEDPCGGPWYLAWHGADTTQATVLTDRATELFDLNAIASGPDMASTLAPGYEWHDALGWTLQGLRDHPGLGGHILTAALQSPVISNRWTTLLALEAWGAGHWDDEHWTLLQTVATSDPRDQTRERAAAILASNTAEQ